MAKNPRTCVGCRRRDTTNNLVRFVVRDHTLVCDDDRNQPGRGAWIHPDPACLTRALSVHAFARALRDSALTEGTHVQVKMNPTRSHLDPGDEER